MEPGFEEGAAGELDVAGGGVGAAAADDAVVAFVFGLLGLGADVVEFLGVGGKVPLVGVPVPADFPGVAADVVEAVAVGLALALGGVVEYAGAGFLVVVGLGVVDGVAVGVGLVFEAASCGAFPFGFGGDAVAAFPPLDFVGGDVGFVCGVGVVAQGGGELFVFVVEWGPAFHFGAGVAPFEHVSPVDAGDGVVVVVGGVVVGSVASVGASGLGFKLVAVFDGPVVDFVPFGFAGFVGAGVEGADGGGVLVFGFVGPGVAAAGDEGVVVGEAEVEDGLDFEVLFYGEGEGFAGFLWVVDVVDSPVAEGDVVFALEFFGGEGDLGAGEDGAAAVGVAVELGGDGDVDVVEGSGEVGVEGFGGVHVDVELGVAGVGVLGEVSGPAGEEVAGGGFDGDLGGGVFGVEAVAVGEAALFGDAVDVESVAGDFVGFVLDLDGEVLGVGGSGFVGGGDSEVGCGGLFVD